MSTITIYKTSRIVPSRNLKIDDIENYLARVPSLTFSNFQYIRPKLDGTIKVNAGQEYAFDQNFVYDYLKVTNGNGERTQYYFINAVEQRSEETLELTLHMDVINTFRDAYEVSPNSIIHREFKDRYKKITTRETVTVRDTAEGLIDPTYRDWDMNHDIGITEVEIELRPFPNTALIKAVAYWGDESLEAFSLEVADQRDFIARYDNGHGRYVTDPDYVEYTFQYDKSDQALPIIDYLSEGISPQLYKSNEEEIPQFAGQSWNLVYRNENDIEASEYNQVNPVNVYLAPDNQINAWYRNESGRTKVPTDFQSNAYTWFAGGNLYADIEFASGRKAYAFLSKEDAYDCWDTYVYSDGSSLTFYRRRYDKQSHRYYSVGWATLRNIKKVIFSEYEYTTGIAVGRFTAIPESRPSYSEKIYTIPLGEIVEGIVYGVSDISLDDARLMKVIKLPYPPSLGTYDENGAIGFENWEYSAGESLYKGSINGNAMDYTWNTGITSPMEPLSVIVEDTHNHHLPWSKDNEPKLFHSDIYQPKFVYDSFSFLFELEKVDRERWNSLPYKNSLNLRFVVTSTINSRFMFIFPDYVLEKSQSNYDNILPVARNNEVTIYSNQYVNYLRTGYNYDVKNKERAQFQTALGLVGNARSYATLPDPLSGGNLLSSFASTTNTIYGNILSIIRAEEAMDQKKISMVNQSTSVQGSDDIDLLLAYSGNKAKMVYYRPSEIMSDAIANLFHYCGYVSERRGTPRENTRHWFDYCQADIEFINERTAPTWAMDEIKMRYSAGITILHNHDNEWDIEQEYENWENSLQ